MLIKQEKYFKYKVIISMAILFLLTGCSNVQKTIIQREKFENKNIQLASQYLSIKKPLQAIARLNKVLTINPNSARAYGLLGVIYQQQEEYLLSQQSFMKALHLTPKDSGIRNNYGTLLYVTGKYNDALKQFYLVSKDVYYENRDQVFKNIGATYLKMSEVKQAVGYYKHALRLNPRLSDVSLKLSELLYKTKDFQEAYHYYRDFVQYGQQNVRSLWLGIQLSHKLQMTEKLSFYGKLLKNKYRFSAEYSKYQTLLNHDSRKKSHNE